MGRLADSRPLLARLGIRFLGERQAKLHLWLGTHLQLGEVVVSLPLRTLSPCHPLSVDVVPRTRKLLSLHLRHAHALLLRHVYGHLLPLCICDLLGVVGHLLLRSLARHAASTGHAHRHPRVRHHRCYTTGLRGDRKPSHARHRHALSVGPGAGVGARQAPETGLEHGTPSSVRRSLLLLLGDRGRDRADRGRRRRRRDLSFIEGVGGVGPPARVATAAAVAAAAVERAVAWQAEARADVLWCRGLGRRRRWAIVTVASGERDRRRHAPAEGSDDRAPRFGCIVTEASA
jgi:hypothetical protein